MIVAEEKQDCDELAGIWHSEISSLRRLCVTLLHGDSHDADEAISRTALHVIQYRGRPVENAAAWLRKVARNICVDLIRERYRRRYEPLDVLSTSNAPAGERALDVPTPEAIYMEGESSRRLRRALEMLPAELSRLVRLYYFEELLLAEIAKQSGMSEANVRRKLRQACDRIEVVLREEDDKPARRRREQSFGVEIPSRVSALQLVQVDTAAGERDVYWLLAEPPVRFSTRALPRLERYVERHPSGWRKRLALARLLRGRGELRQAIAHYEDVVWRRPAHVLAWIELAECVDVAWGHAAAANIRAMAARSVTREAAPFFGALAETDDLASLAEEEGDNVYLWSLLARRYAEAGRLEASARAFDRALELDPQSSILLAMSHDVLRAIGRDQEACVRLASALANDPSNVIALQRELVRRAHVHEEATTHETAVLARRLRAVAGHAVDTIHALAVHARACGAEKRSMELALSLVREHPRNPEAWLRYADLHLKSEKLP